MTPVLAERPARYIRFTLDATEDELWPSFLSEFVVSDPGSLHLRLHPGALILPGI